MYQRRTLFGSGDDIAACGRVKMSLVRRSVLIYGLHLTRKFIVEGERELLIEFEQLFGDLFSRCCVRDFLPICACFRMMAKTL